VRRGTSTSRFPSPRPAVIPVFHVRHPVSRRAAMSNACPTAPHTGIGLLALAINALEANPLEPYMTRKNPLFPAMQCYAHYGHLDGKIKDTLKLASEEGKRGDKALKKLAGLIAGLGGPEKASVTTTRAVDLIKVRLNPCLRTAADLSQGGVKVNALPELSQAVINHRINTDSSVGELQESMIDVLQPLTEEYGLSFRAFGKDISEVKDGRGTLTLAEAFDSA
jgi:Gly-Xaa carboxypeptidase